PLPARRLDPGGGLPVVPGPSSTTPTGARPGARDDFAVRRPAPAAAGRPDRAAEAGQGEADEGAEGQRRRPDVRCRHSGSAERRAVRAVAGRATAAPESAARAVW